MLKLGFVGYGSHAVRLSKLLKTLLGSYDVVKYHPCKISNDSTTNLSDLSDCDAVFITSPNKTHFEYIHELLKMGNAKIFCEKPPCTSRSEIEQLFRLGLDDKSRVFFNFNYRFSELSKFIQSSIADGLIGDVMHVHGVMSHGLAFKEGYEKTWRGKYPENESAVLDTSAIHLVDLCNYFLGGYLEINSATATSFKHGLDSFAIGLESKDKVSVSLYASYAAPSRFSFMVLGTDGFVEASDKSLVIKHPRDTFDENGFFVTPPTHSDQEYSFERDYHGSLKSALDYFLNKTEAGDGFSNADFDLSLETTRIIVEALSS